MADFTAAHAADIASMQSGTANFGILSLSWNIDILAMQITIDATLVHKPIGHIVLSPAQPSANISEDLGFASADVTLTGNFTTKEIDYNIDVKMMGNDVVKKQGKLVGW